MSSRGFRVIWLRLRQENGKRFHLHFPIYLNVFIELLDSFADIMAVACVFVPKRFDSRSEISVRTMRELTLMLIALLGSITDDGPYDLVDVKADNVYVSIKVR